MPNFQPQWKVRMKFDLPSTVKVYGLQAYRSPATAEKHSDCFPRNPLT
jgi:hypothetical protein